MCLPVSQTGTLRSGRGVAVPMPGLSAHEGFGLLFYLFCLFLMTRVSPQVVDELGN